MRTDNHSWIIEVGHAVIQKKSQTGVGSLAAVEKLIYCLWVADYGMRNAGDLDTAQDVYADFQNEAAQLSQELGLKLTHNAFALPTGDLQREYFERFEGICDEIRRAAHQFPEDVQKLINLPRGSAYESLLAELEKRNAKSLVAELKNMKARKNQDS